MQVQRQDGGSGSTDTSPAVQQTMFALLGDPAFPAAVPDEYFCVFMSRGYMLHADAMRMYFLQPRFYATAYPYFGVRSKMVSIGCSLSVTLVLAMRCGLQQTDAPSPCRR